MRKGKLQTDIANRKEEDRTLGMRKTKLVRKYRKQKGERGTWSKKETATRNAF